MNPIIISQPIFSPSIYPGGLAWYNGSVTPAGAVASWTDQFGNGNAATQGAGAQQPIATASSINGLTGLAFTAGNNSKFVLPSAVQTATTYSTSHTLFIVFRSDLTSASNGQMLISTSQGGAGTDLLAVSIKANVLCIGYYNGSYQAISIPFTDTANAHTLSISHTANTTPTAILDRKILTGTTNPFADTQDGGQIGSGTVSNTYNFTGTMGEMIIYNQVLSSANINQVNAYLKYKWGTP